MLINNNNISYNVLATEKIKKLGNEISLVPLFFVAYMNKV